MITSEMADDKLAYEERLIELVKERPHLYLRRHKDYKNKAMKEVAWTGIGNQLGKPGDVCKNSWISLRQQYLAFRRKLDSPSAPVNLNGGRPHFRHENSMALCFDMDAEERLLNTHVVDVEDTEMFAGTTDGNQNLFFVDESLSNNSLASNDAKFQPRIIRGVKRSLDQTAENVEITMDQPVSSQSVQIDSTLDDGREDEFDTFCKTMAVKLRRLHKKSPKMCAETELKIHQLIFDAQFN